MRVAFLGLPLAALLLHSDGHTISIAGLRSGLTTGQRRLISTIGQRNIVVDPQNDWTAFREKLKCIEPDLLVSWFYTRRIPMAVVNECKLGGIGVHPSLLPRHRGPDPYYAAIDAGDLVSGVTVHRIDENYDTGAVLDQESLNIGPTWNAWQLAKALDRPSIKLLRRIVRALADGKAIPAIAQDESMATQAPSPTDDDRVLRWNRPAQAIVRRIRALAPSPGAVAFIADGADETEITVSDAAVADVYEVLLPGEAAVIDGKAVVRAADTGVALLRGEVDGQNWCSDDIARRVALSVDVERRRSCRE